uniref:Coiled-coil domain containing 134 n=1 Tax=Pipistrellus kuhlii TaxID=59472 RepID=A0A7J7RD58_PIPKU|nr:coiled-coil domain containing 134 [Pipistrellus kuhlii]
MDLLQFLVFLFVLLVCGTRVTDTQRTSVDPSLEIYKKLFEVKRREQLLALKNLVQLNDVHQQYKILDVMLQGLFKIISSTDPFQKALREEEKRRKKEEKRKEIRKGPRISRSQSEL